MVPIFYFITFVLSLIMTGVNIFRSKKADTRFVLLSLTVTCSCLGMYLVAVSPTLELALWAHKLLYIGGCFTAPIIIFAMAQLCGFIINKLIYFLLIGIAVVNYCFVLTIGNSGIYYASVELAYSDGYYYLVKEYGPAHVLYVIQMILCFLLMLYYVIMAVRYRNRISRRVVLSVSLFGVAIILIYVIERIFHSTVEWLSVGYLASAFVLVRIFDRFNMYDMTINVAGYVERMQGYGYIVFDKKFRYVNSNEFARKLFPEIENWQTDKEVAPEESLIYRKVVQDLPQWKNEGGKRELFVDDKYVELCIQDISYSWRNKPVGCIIEITDKTVEQKYRQTIENYNYELSQEVKEKTANIIYIKDKLMLGMAAMIEGRDNSTGGHIRRTSDVIEVFSAYLSIRTTGYVFTDEFLEMLIKAAPMHDLGKITVDDRVLRKQGKFTEEEYEEMKKHSEQGAIIVEKVLKDVEDDEFVTIAKNVAHYHHEKWNGKGYPCGLSKEEIPVEARIMALADVFDALVSKRCYKDAFSFDKAFSIIEEDLGSHFDPYLGKIFLECRGALEELYSNYE